MSITFSVSEIRQSRKIATVAAALDMDESQIRDLIDNGELDAHGIGKRGIRVYLDSIAAYQQARSRAPKEKARRTIPHRPRTPQIAGKASEAALRASGILT